MRDEQAIPVGKSLRLRDPGRRVEHISGFSPAKGRAQLALAEGCSHRHLLLCTVACQCAGGEYTVKWIVAGTCSRIP